MSLVEIQDTMTLPDQPSAPGTRRRPYWSERQGRRARASLTPEQARKAFVGLVSGLVREHELDEAFGYDCVDDGQVPGTLGGAIEERLLILLGREGLWPIDLHHADLWDDDTLFDMMEFLHDHVSTPVAGTGRHHSFDNCGWHYKDFKSEPARTRYRQLVNEILIRMEPGFDMTSEGEVVHAVPDGVSPLLESAPRRLNRDDRSHVESAIIKYRARSSTSTDRRDAVRDLADVLESLRVDVKATMPSKDEAMLFEIANKFWIRHNKPGEQRDYDHEAWWSWLFYVYLASIALVSHLADRPASPSPPP